MCNDSFRSLSESEIRQLEQQSCSAEDWNNIKVSHNFSPLYIHNVTFSGTINLGSFEKVYELPGGVKKHSGIYNAILHNVSVGDNCCIWNIKNYIANYNIANDTKFLYLTKREDAKYL